MSHLIFIIPGLKAGATLQQVKAGKPITQSVQLSNITFEGLWEELGFDKRRFVNRDDPTDVMELTYHTTIHDTVPVGMDGDDLINALEECAIEGDQVDNLYMLAEIARETGDHIWVF
jgi:hypothetical protein